MAKRRTPVSRVHGRLLATAVLLFGLAIPTSSRDDEGSVFSPQRVVVVEMSDFLMQASMPAVTAMRDTLASYSDAPIVFSTDALHVSSEMKLPPRREAPERARLQEKYTSTRVDLIIAAGSPALEFVERNRSAIWPRAPVVYYGVLDYRSAGKKYAPDIGGFAIHFDVAGTLALAMQLQPDANHLVYVGGVAPYDRLFEPLFDDALWHQGKRFGVTKLIGLPLAALQRRLASLPPNTIVLYSTMFRDTQGGRYVPDDVVRSLVESSAAPVYGFTGSYLERGIVGGATVDFEEHGRRAGLLAASVLNRDTELLAPLPRTASPSKCILDVRQMQRWNIPPGRAPPHCEVLYAGTVAGANRNILLLAAVAATLAAALAAALHNQTRKRDAAEQEAVQRRQEAAHAARLALVGEISASIVHEVTQPLSAILSNADAADMLLERDNPSLQQVRGILADIRRDDARAHQIVSRLRTLLKKGDLRIDSLDLNELTASAISLIEAEARHRKVAVSSINEPTLPPVAGDPVHLQQVLLNLFINALDSMESVPAGERLLEIRTSRLGSHAVCVSVRDSGRGIAAESLPRVFDSFFTTKAGGMGLGLSIAKAIVDAHGGELEAASAPSSRGAEFRLTLPTRRVRRLHLH